MRAKGFLYETTLRSGFKDWVGPGYPYTFFDAFNPEARKLFWAQVERDLFRRGMDAWWMDATEPDLLPTPDLDAQRAHMHPTAMGSGSRVLNTWTALRQQIAGGLNFSLSGIPYWTVDIGRFSRKDPLPEDAEEWRELNTRWFEYGTFLPLTRVHGEAPKREMWEMGGESHPAYQAHLKFDRLRYRMLPYVYSLAGAVTHEAGTFLRPLVMDFPRDAASRRVADQFLFGPAFLVSPVTEYEARRRPVVLPLGASWYDFWTGAMIAGGQTIDAPAPYDAMPLHVRAGSTGRPGDPFRLRGCRRGLHPLRGRRAHLRLREGRVLAHPPSLERHDDHAHDRQARGLVPRNARVADVRGGRGREGEAGRLHVRAEGRPHPALRRCLGRASARVSVLA
jgi:alpha-D-xyloside xylohydrolase